MLWWNIILRHVLFTMVTKEDQSFIKEFLKRQNAKRKLFIVNEKSEDYLSFYCGGRCWIDPEIVILFIELIYNSEDGQDCYSEVDCLYDDLYFLTKKSGKKD